MSQATLQHLQAISSAMPAFFCIIRLEKVEVEQLIDGVLAARPIDGNDNALLAHGSWAGVASTQFDPKPAANTNTITHTSTIKCA